MEVGSVQRFHMFIWLRYIRFLGKSTIGVVGNADGALGAWEINNILITSDWKERSFLVGYLILTQYITQNI